MDGCPGQDRRSWKAGDLFEVPCPSCGKVHEFYRDEPFLLCRGCGERIRNPRLAPGCEQWCPAADSCREKGERGSKPGTNDY
jgi:hypothetical protein